MLALRFESGVVLSPNAGPVPHRAVGVACAFALVLALAALAAPGDLDRPSERMGASSSHRGQLLCDSRSRTAGRQDPSGRGRRRSTAPASAARAGRVARVEQRLPRGAIERGREPRPLFDGGAVRTPIDLANSDYDVAWAVAAGPDGTVVLAAIRSTPAEHAISRLCGTRRPALSTQASPGTAFRPWMSRPTMPRGRSGSARPQDRRIRKGRNGLHRRAVPGGRVPRSHIRFGWDRQPAGEIPPCKTRPPPWRSSATGGFLWREQPIRFPVPDGLRRRSLPPKRPTRPELRPDGIVVTETPGMQYFPVRLLSRRPAASSLPLWRSGLQDRPLSTRRSSRLDLRHAVASFRRRSVPCTPILLQSGFRLTER